MSAPNKHLNIRWSEESSASLSEEAVFELVVALEPADAPKWVSVTGRCPTCQGPLRHRQPLQVFLGDDQVEPELVEPYRVVVWCDCQVHHTGADTGVTGCGRYFALDVEIGAP